MHAISPRFSRAELAVLRRQDHNNPRAFSREIVDRICEHPRSNSGSFISASIERADRPRPFHSAAKDLVRKAL